MKLKRILLCLLFIPCGLYRIVAQSDTVKIMHYNLLSFGQPCGSISTTDKYNWLGEILEHAQPDIMTVNELGPNVVLGNGIIQLSFDYTSGISQGDLTNEAGSNFVNQIFYRNDKFGYAGVEIINGIVRDINVYKLYPLASAQPGGDTLFFHCIVAHLKAGNSTSDQTQRSNAANNIINWIAVNPSARNVLLLGDLNVGGSSEMAFQNLINPTNPANRLLDPINKQNGWGGASNAIYHTQSTRSSFIDCGSTGGMDDRFDMILAKEAVINGTAGMQYVPDSYHALGNDGNSYNTALGCAGNNTVPNNVCSRLQLMSDHLPVIAEFSLNLSTSIEDDLIPGLSLHISPNPFGDILSIGLTEATPIFQNVEVELTDIWGRKVRNASVTASSLLEFDTADLPTGLYVLQVSDRQGRRISRKIVKR
ncbi:MAG: T9SS type A sorting domain-containing protein [Bacteroidota bacterium]